MPARKQYPLRIDPAVWDAIELWAKDDMRSANAQVEWILRDALRRAGRMRDEGAPHGGRKGASGDAAQAATPRS